jgi:hypothetical protein
VGKLGQLEQPQNNNILECFSGRLNDGRIVLGGFGFSGRHRSDGSYIHGNEEVKYLGRAQ